MKHILLTTIAAVVLVGCGEPSNPNLGLTELDMQLIQASKRDDTQIVEDLIKSGANVDSIWTGVERRSAWGNWMGGGSFRSSEFTWIVTPLHNAILHDRGNKHGVKVAKTILDNGADIEIKNKEGSTPLHRAVTHASVTMIELLISRGADIDAKNNDGLTPLDSARLEANMESSSLGSVATNVNIEPRQQVVNLLRKHGGKTGEELKAEGK